MSSLHDLKQVPVIFFAAIINKVPSSSSMKIIVLRNSNEAKLHCHWKFYGLQLLKRQEAVIEMCIFEIQKKVQRICIILFTILDKTEVFPWVTYKVKRKFLKNILFVYDLFTVIYSLSPDYSEKMEGQNLTYLGKYINFRTLCIPVNVLKPTESDWIRLKPTEADRSQQKPTEADWIQLKPTDASRSRLKPAEGIYSRQTERLLFL